MSYVDGFVVAVPTANRDAYRVHAEKAIAMMKEFGALSVVVAGAALTTCKGTVVVCVLLPSSPCTVMV